MAAGGTNTIPILPVSQIAQQSLAYPLGIADVENITGKPVDLKAFQQLPKMLFIGPTTTTARKTAGSCTG